MKQNERKEAFGKNNIKYRCEETKQERYNTGNIMSYGFGPCSRLSFFHNEYESWGRGDMIDRSHWADKSSAALNRERIADRLLDNFLDKCSKLNPSLFPITDVVVKARIHLTNACYKSFRK
jgi:hypothetical protein